MTVAVLQCPAATLARATVPRFAGLVTPAAGGGMGGPAFLQFGGLTPFRDVCGWPEAGGGYAALVCRPRLPLTW